MVKIKWPSSSSSFDRVTRGVQKNRAFQLYSFKSQKLLTNRIKDIRIKRILQSGKFINNIYMWSFIMQYWYACIYNKCVHNNSINVWNPLSWKWATYCIAFVWIIHAYIIYELNVIVVWSRVHTLWILYVLEKAFCNWTQIFYT